MTVKHAIWHVRRPLVVLPAAAVLIGLGTLVRAGVAAIFDFTERPRVHPGEISIKHGETLQMINDDADLLHHAYVDSPKFSFDSGDQQPDSKTDITFPVAGDFDVLCAIHPKMRLTVHVQ